MVRGEVQVQVSVVVLPGRVFRADDVDHKINYLLFVKLILRVC